MRSLATLRPRARFVTIASRGIRKVMMLTIVSDGVTTKWNNMTRAAMTAGINRLAGDSEKPGTVDTSKRRDSSITL